MLSEVERQRLARLMYMAFCDLRALALAGRIGQAKALAEAFHNVPLLMYSSDFSLQAFRNFLERYQSDYQGKLRFDYLEEWEKLS